jgi:hypothetical protein
MKASGKGKNESIRSESVGDMIADESKEQIEREALYLISNGKPLLRLLELVRQAGKKGIATRMLLYELQSNELHSLIKRAEQVRYLERVKVPPPRGTKGNWSVVNKLTTKGRRVLRFATDLEGKSERGLWTTKSLLKESV